MTDDMMSYDTCHVETSMLRLTPTPPKGGLNTKAV